MAIVPSVWVVEAAISPVIVISCKEAVFPSAPPGEIVTFILPFDAFSTYSLKATDAAWAFCVGSPTSAWATVILIVFCAAMAAGPPNRADPKIKTKIVITVFCINLRLSMVSPPFFLKH